MPVAHDQPRARIPPQPRIVVARWANGFSLLVPGHRIPQPFVGLRAAAWHAVPQPRLGPALGDDSRVIRALVLVTKPTDGKYQPWQFAAVEAVLDAHARTAKGKGHPAGVSAVLTAARAAALAGKADPKVRVAAVRLLGRDSAVLADDITKLGSLLVPQSPAAVQSAAVSALGRIADDRAADALLSGWAGYSPTLQAQAIDALLDRDAWVPKVLATVSAGKLPASG